ncbi:MAG: extracellular solute-binding protein [Candidatus Marinimicrobia bacterium]|nr:extracellular solute-binding protein [Candidatus Neomarinimicrobiota bacterium]
MESRRKIYGIFFTIFILAIILVLVINLIFINKDRVPSKGVTRLYFADNMSEAHQIIIRKFNARYTGEIEIIPIDLPFSKFTTNERKELLARSLRSRGSRIDIFAVDQIWVPRFTKWCEPLSRYFMQTHLNHILPQALSTCYYNNMLVGLPLYIDIGVMYYRSDILAQLHETELQQSIETGVTWEELFAFGDRHPDIRPLYVIQGDDYEGLVCNYIEILKGMGGSIIDDGQLVINTVQGRQATKFLYDLIFRYNYMPVETAGFNERISYFYALDKDAPFFRGWSSFLKDMAIPNADSVKVKYLCAAMPPYFKGYSPATLFGGWNLMVSRYSKNKVAAMKFLEYTISDEVQEILFETSGYLPISEDIYKDPKILQKYPYIIQLKAMMEHGTHRPMLSDYTKISDILSLYLNKVLKNEVSAEEALEKTEEQIRKRQFLMD